MQQTGKSIPFLQGMPVLLFDTEKDPECILHKSFVVYCSLKKLLNPPERWNKIKIALIFIFRHFKRCCKSNSLTAALSAFLCHLNLWIMNSCLFPGCICFQDLSPVCVNMISSLRYRGSSLSSPWQWELLWKHRCSLSQHSCYWCNDTGLISELTHAAWDIKQRCSYARTRVTRRHIYHRGESHRYSFLSSLPPGWLTGVRLWTLIACVYILVCIIPETLKCLKKTHL